MFTLDPRIRGLPVGKEQVVALHQSINAPHVAIPGKKAGPAQAYLVAIRASAGLSVFVYLYLPEVSDCAVYDSGNRNFGPAELEAEEADAQAFVESMGFMMDNLNFSTLDGARQEELMAALPVFQRSPPSLGNEREMKPAGETSQAASGPALARLFASF